MTEKSRQTEVEGLMSLNESPVNREWIKGLSPRDRAKFG